MARKRLSTRLASSGPQFKLQVARAIVMERAPYFGSVLYSMYPVEVDKIRRVVRKSDGMYVQEMDTFGVTAKGLLLYTPKALEKWSEANLVFVLAHETLHILLDHCDRGVAAGYDPQLFNIACDIFINAQLREGGWTDPPPTDCWPETWGFEEGLTADEYYHLLLKKRAEQQEKKDQRGEQDQCPQCGGDPEDGDHQQGGKPEGQDEEGEGQEGGCPNSPGKIDGEPDLTNIGDSMGDDNFGHCGSGAGTELENEKGLEGDAADAQRSPAEMDSIRTNAAAEMEKAAREHPGSVPDGLSKWAAAKLGPPQVSWREHLRRAGRRSLQWAQGKEDYRYGKMHRRQAMYGWGSRSIVMPTMVAPVPTIMVAVDTSGSMTQDELGIALREIDGVFKHMKCKIIVVSCDAAVNEMTPCENWQEAARSLKGGGGTSFIPIFEAVDDMPQPPDVLIIATDGGGPAPAKAPRGYKTIWVLTGEYLVRPCDWGIQVEVKD